MKILFLLIFSFCLQFSYSQDIIYLKVHFLYGSKPAKQFKNSEAKWFGGKLGGHVGIEVDSNKIFNFIPKGEFHIFQKKSDKHSTFTFHSYRNFYSILGGDADSNKKAIVYIPITQKQKASFDSICAIYLQQTPYDYALFGMRCGAAACDILGILNILPKYSTSKAWKKTLYPKKLRKILFKKATENNWHIERYEGSIKRKWEKD